MLAVTEKKGQKMYTQGIISAVEGYKAKIIIKEFDDFETNWLDVPQLFTVNNKSGFLPEIGALVSAVLNDDMTEGAILGAIYNSIDKPPKDMEGTEYFKFSDGVEVYHVPDTNQLFITADVLCLDVNQLVVTGDIKAYKNITDKSGSMQKMRDTYNQHLHTNGNNGSNTGTPINQMS